MKIKKVKDWDIRSCNHCYARNYQTSLFPTVGRRVDVLYDLVIDHTMLCLCEDCLKELKELIEGEGF